VRFQYRRQDPLPLPADETESLLPFGNGRSYGDVYLNDGATLIDACPLDRVIAFDPATGALRCEAGVLLAEILTLGVPHGWFPPVTFGTRFVTLGRAIANDVHGKNHHHRGTFSRHVRVFELLRSDGSQRLCSPTENLELYRATIGWLGLTGLITWASLPTLLARRPCVSRIFLPSSPCRKNPTRTMNTRSPGWTVSPPARIWAEGSSSVAITPGTHPPTFPSRRGSGSGYPATYLCQSSTVRPSDFSTPPSTGVTRPGSGKKPCTTSPFSTRRTASATGTASTGPRGFFSTNAWYRRPRAERRSMKSWSVPPGPAPALSWRY